MKKLTTTITTINGIKKEISVWLNEETAEKLEKCDVNILHEYILEEYKSRLIERKETRRHQSLYGRLVRRDNIKRAGIDRGTEKSVASG